MSSQFIHRPVLVQEVLDALVLSPGGTYVDCTAGGAGHASEIVRRIGSSGRLIALDRDGDAVKAATERLSGVAAELGDAAPSWEVVHAPFSRLDSVLSERSVARASIDGILADLGVSSPQLDRPERGFSFGADGPLDMRMDPDQPPSAADLVNQLPEEELARVLYTLGDESQSRRIARVIVQRREDQPFERTADLAAVIEKAKGGRRGARTHPATRSFQALRMKVNEELDELGSLLDSGHRWLRPGGRWVLITFHSGEDRPVKRRFTELSRDCVCPSAQPICTCDHRASLRLPRPWTLTATDDEIAANPRARSARLRIAERLPHPENTDA